MSGKQNAVWQVGMSGRQDAGWLACRHEEQMQKDGSESAGKNTRSKYRQGKRQKMRQAERGHANNNADRQTYTIRKVGSKAVSETCSDASIQKVSESRRQ